MTSMWIFYRRRWLRAIRGEVAAIAGVAAVLLLAASLQVLEDFRSDRLQQQRRTAEQGRLVDAMEALRNPAVSELVTDWLLTYPRPSEERLAELRDLARQVQTDPAPLLGASIPLAGTERPVPDRSRARIAWVAPTALVRRWSSH
jgi:hypothetical protein